MNTQPNIAQLTVTDYDLVSEKSFLQEVDHNSLNKILTKFCTINRRQRVYRVVL